MSSHAVGYDKQARWIGSRYRTGDTLNCKQAVLVGLPRRLIPASRPVPISRSFLASCLSRRLERSSLAGWLSRSFLASCLSRRLERSSLAGWLSRYVSPLLLALSEFANPSLSRVCVEQAPPIT